MLGFSSETFPAIKAMHKKVLENVLTFFRHAATIARYAIERETAMYTVVLIIISGLVSSILQYPLHRVRSNHECIIPSVL